MLSAQCFLYNPAIYRPLFANMRANASARGKQRPYLERHTDRTLSIIVHNHGITDILFSAFSCGRLCADLPHTRAIPHRENAACMSSADYPAVSRFRVPTCYTALSAQALVPHDWAFQALYPQQTFDLRPLFALCLGVFITRIIANLLFCCCVELQFIPQGLVAIFCSPLSYFL